MYLDFCNQLSGRPEKKEKSIDSLIDLSRRVDKLNKEIDSLKAAIARSKQFNQKVELNLKLKELEKEFGFIIG